MKNLYYTILIALSAAVCFAACSDNQSAQIPEDDFFEFGDELTISRDFNVYSETRAENLQLRFTARFDTNLERVVEYKIQSVENDIAKDLDISYEELDRMLIQELGENYTDMQALEANLAQAKTEAAENFSLTNCLNGCHDKFTDANGNKVKGRGACKFGCWAERVLKFIEIIVETIF